MEACDLLDNDDEGVDPVALLEALLHGMPGNVPLTERVILTDNVARLLARAPLAALDVFARDVRQKLGVTKETLRVQVHAIRATRPRDASRTVPSFEPTPDDLKSAEDILRSPGIEERFTEDMHRMGVVGEPLNLILLLLVVISRLLDKPISLAFKSASSAGKSFLMNVVLSTLPPGECIVFTAASAKALYYRTDSFAHKVLAFMERPGVEDNDYQVRVLQSEGKLVYAVAEKDPDTGQIATVDRVIEGPVAYIETTTQATIHDENETRLFSASLDEGAEATRKILAEQARRAAQGDDDATHVLRVWMAAHSMLQPARVVVPFAERIPQHFPARLVRARRDFPRFLSLIEASALLYQHQRERDSHGAVVATLDDYALARRVAAPLLESAVSGATAKTRELIAAAREFASAEGRGDPLSVMITANKLTKRLPGSGWSKATVRRHLKSADDAGYLDLVSSPRGQEFEYKLTKLDDEICLFLPDPAGLMSTDLPTEVNQPDQGASTVDDALNSTVANDIAEVNQLNQGGQGDRPLFPTPRGFHDPDFQ